jgi:hypothetical protein
MNVFVMGMIDLHSLWSWKRTPVPMLLASIHSGRMLQFQTQKRRKTQAAGLASKAQSQEEELKDQKSQKKAKTVTVTSSGNPGGGDQEITSPPTGSTPAVLTRRLVGKQADPATTGNMAGSSDADADAIQLGFAYRRGLLSRKRQNDHDDESIDGPGQWMHPLRKNLQHAGA